MQGSMKSCLVHASLASKLLCHLDPSSLTLGMKLSEAGDAAAAAAFAFVWQTVARVVHNKQTNSNRFGAACCSSVLAGVHSAQ